jgi:hypothetical protein
MTTTHTNKPKITQTDIHNGYVTRYFVRNVSTKVVTEIDKKQYEAFKNNVLYERIEFPWVITGLANDQLSTDNKIIYGTKHKNTVTTQFYNKRLPGLDRVLRNPLEYFIGTLNTSEPLVPLTTQMNIPTFQVSVPTSSAEPEPEPTGSLTITSLLAGDGHFTILRSDNTLWSWGYSSGPLGWETSYLDPNILVPTQVSGSWASASLGGYSLWGIKTDGTLWACGENSNGQLGLGSVTDAPAFTLVDSGLWKYVGDANFSVHQLAIKSDGTLWAAGANGAGQLGNGSSFSELFFVQIGSDTDWEYVHMAYQSSFGIKTDGTLWAWGDNSEGQLGLGDTTSRNVPTQVGAYTDWVKVVGSYMWSVGLRADGTLWFAGGDNGQCGYPDAGFTYPALTFTQIGSDTDWIDLDMGDEYHIVRKSNGTIYTWGANYDGMIGNGSSTGIVCTPFAVDNGSTGWTHIAGGGYDPYAIKDNKLYFWGANYQNPTPGVGGIVNTPQTTPVEHVSSSVVMPPT